MAKGPSKHKMEKNLNRNVDGTTTSLEILRVKIQPVGCVFFDLFYFDHLLKQNVGVLPRRTDLYNVENVKNTQLNGTSSDQTTSSELFGRKLVNVLYCMYILLRINSNKCNSKSYTRCVMCTSPACRNAGDTL